MSKVIFFLIAWGSDSNKQPASSQPEQRSRFPTVAPWTQSLFTCNPCDSTPIDLPSVDWTWPTLVSTKREHCSREAHYGHCFPLFWPLLRSRMIRLDLMQTIHLQQPAAWRNSFHFRTRTQITKSQGVWILKQSRTLDGVFLRKSLSGLRSYTANRRKSWHHWFSLFSTCLRVLINCHRWSDLFFFFSVSRHHPPIIILNGREHLHLTLVNCKTLSTIAQDTQQFIKIEHHEASAILPWPWNAQRPSANQKLGWGG